MTFQAIVTKYHGPTNTQAGRISAKASAGRVMVEYNHGLSQEANHDAAALKLVSKFGWSGNWHRGGMPGGDGNVYVCSPLSGPSVSWAFDIDQEA